MPRSLYLLAQVAGTGVPLVVALTMLDLCPSATGSPTAAREPDALAAALAASLGIPVVPVDSRNRADEGLRMLGRAVDAVAEHPRRVTGIATPDAVSSDLAQEVTDAEALFEWVEQVTNSLAPELASAAYGNAAPGSGRFLRRTFSDRVEPSY